MLKKNLIPDRFFPFIIIIWVSAVYFYSLFNGFAYDDMQFIVKNSFIHDIKNIKSLFIPGEYPLKFNELSYRPLATLSYMIIFFFWKINPFGYHLASLIFHILNAMLVFYTARIIFKNEFYSLTASLFFCLHPALSEAVFCISYNEELISAFFFLLSFYIYLKKHGKGFISAMFFFFLALLAKEMALCLPLIILSYEAVFNTRKENLILFFKSFFSSIKSRLPYFISLSASLLSYLLLRFKIFYSPDAGSFDYSASLLKRMIYIPYQLFQFIKITLFPVFLNADYSFAYPSNFMGMENIFSIIIFLAVITAFILLIKANNIAAFGLSWFIFALIPVLNIIPLANPIAERYLYLPLAGFALFIAGLINFIKTKKYSALLNFFLIIILIVFSLRIITLTSSWKDDSHLWISVLKANPKSYKANNSLGMESIKNNDLNNAEKYFIRALEINPRYSTAYNNLGFVYYDRGDYEKASENFNKAINYNPSEASGYFNQATAYDRMEKFNDALSLYIRAIELNPFFDPAYSNAAIIYDRLNRTGDAIRLLMKAIEINNSNISAFNNLGIIYAKGGRLKDAIEVWEKGLKIKPDDEKLKANINKAKKMLLK